jgi:hypothetical protein
MTEISFLVEEDCRGGYLATAIGEAIFTQCDSPEELRKIVRDAVQSHFAEAKLPIRLPIA